MKKSDYKIEERLRDQFKLNDRVFHILYGWGTIIEDNRNIKICVKFEQEDDEYISSSDLKKYVDCRLLSFTEYSLDGISSNRSEIRNQKLKELGI